MRPDVAEKAHQRSLRNDTVEEPLEKAAATLVGFVGSVFRRPRGTVRRLRRAGYQSRTTIWHTESLAAPHDAQNMRGQLFPFPHGPVHNRFALGVDSGAAIGPRRGLLDLGGQPQQQIFAAVRSDELNTDREALGRHVQRERDGGIAGDVPWNRERADIGHPPSYVGWMLARSQLEES